MIRELDFERPPCGDEYHENSAIDFDVSDLAPDLAPRLGRNGKGFLPESFTGYSNQHGAVWYL